MPTTLLRPKLLTFKNRLLHERHGSIFNRELLVVLVAVGIAVAIYYGSTSFLAKLAEHPDYDPLIPTRLLGVSFLAFFTLLIFSNAVAAIGTLYGSKELPLLLTAPVSSLQLYVSRFIEILFSSSWMFLLFCIPSLLAFSSALHLPREYLLTCALVIPPFLIIPTGLAIICVTIFVNVIPPYRLRDLLVVVAFLLVCGGFAVNQNNPAPLSTEHEQLQQLIAFLQAPAALEPKWLPSHWATEAIVAHIRMEPGKTLAPLALLYGFAIIVLLAGYFIFHALFLRGWNVSLQTKKTLKVYRSGFTERLGRIVIPFNPPFRAMIYKEARMFIRDTTQSVQLVMLLMLTFIYLYNFRSLRLGSRFDEAHLHWWQVVLSVSNIAFGVCVISAIATRFVFPSVSLEGRAYILLRDAPLSLTQLLRYKFLTWFFPVVLLSEVLLISGALAIQVPMPAVLVTAFVSVAVSIGIVGLGIGTGAVYAKFDWDSPANVTASFGSLVYMVFSLGLIIICLIPTLLLYVLTCVPGFLEHMGAGDYYMTIACCMILLVIINTAVARKALSAGNQRLSEREN